MRSCFGDVGGIVIEALDEEGVPRAQRCRQIPVPAAEVNNKSALCPGRLENGIGLPGMCPTDRQHANAQSDKDASQAESRRPS